MSLEWIKQILNDRTETGLKGDQLFCALIIASFANRNTGECFPRLATIAAALDRSERTVQRLIKELNGRIYEISDGRGRGKSISFKLIKHDTCVGLLGKEVGSKGDTRDTFFAENTTKETLKHDKSIAKTRQPNQPHNINHSLLTRRVNQREGSTSLPENFTLTDKMIAWAEEHRPDVSAAVATIKFINHFRSTDHARSDWEAAWQNWILNERPSGAVGNRRRTDADISAESAAVYRNYPRQVGAPSPVAEIDTVRFTCKLCHDSSEVWGGAIGLVPCPDCNTAQSLELSAVG